jgi:hypothetical protein
MVRGPREAIELHTCYDAQLARSDRREQRIKSGPAILGAADAVVYELRPLPAAGNGEGPKVFKLPVW